MLLLVIEIIECILCVLLLLCAFVVPINVGNYKTESVVYAEGESSVSTKLTSLGSTLVSPSS